MRFHSSLPRPSEIRLPAKVRQIDTGCGTALSHRVEAVNDRLQTETQPEGPPPDNRAQVNGLGFQSLGSIASDRDVRGARAMSAMPPIPTELMRHSKTTRCAICDICAAADGTLTRSHRAHASSVGGTSGLSTLAVLRLILSSYLIGAWTGRSAGFSALRISLTTASGASEAIGYKVPGLRHGHQVGPLFFR